MQMELHIWVSYPEGSKFSYPTEGCGEMCPQHDYEERVWRHLNFFQHKTFIHAKLPRVRCKNHGVSTVDVPWARKGSGFTLLFEAWVIELAKHLPVDVIAKMVGEHDTRLWRFIANYPLLRSVFLFSADQFSTLSRSSDLLHSDHSFFSF